MNLEQYRKTLGWNKNEMARQAGIDTNTVNKALRGESISTVTAKKLVKAISKELGQSVRIQDIEGLKVSL